MSGVTPVPLSSRYSSFASTGDGVPEFGSDAMRAEFPMDFASGKVFCNQGSYGVCPNRVLKYRHDLLDEFNSCGDLFIRIKARPAHDDALNKVAKLVGADKENIVFVPNATYGMNNALKNLELSPEDLVLHDSHVYPSVGSMVDCLATNFDADVLSIDLDFPIKSEEQVVEQFAQTCKMNRSIKVAVIAHISSCSAIVFPVAKIAEALSELGVTVVVDGAHAPAQLELNLEELGRRGVSFYVGNLHKWCFAPRPAAFLWARADRKESVMPIVTGIPYRKGFTEDFFYPGTFDYGNYLASSAAIDFLNELGGREAVAGYVSPLLEWAQKMLAESLGTEALPVPKSMEAPFMRCVALPPVPHLRAAHETSEALIKQVMQHSAVVAQFMTFNGRMWIRLSGGIYNSKEDYTKLRDAVVKRLKL